MMIGIAAQQMLNRVALDSAGDDGAGPALVGKSFVEGRVHLDEVVAVDLLGKPAERFQIAHPALGNFQGRQAPLPLQLMARLGQAGAEIAGVPLPRLIIPDAMAVVNARLLTLLAGITRRPPLWGLSLDQALIMKQGLQVDGSKAVRELGLVYTPIRQALEEEVALAQADQAKP